MADKPLRILYLEDCDEDVELVQAVLGDRLGPCDILRATNRETFETGLREGGVDLVLSDNSLPSFDGLTALALARTLRPDLPFILISGTVSETLTRECLQRGADGCAQKHQLGLLPSMVRSALEKAGHRGKK
jgi:two-component system, cell cycle sensor histidine kinase and response regulator CckA